MREMQQRIELPDHVLPATNDSFQFFQIRVTYLKYLHLVTLKSTWIIGMKKNQ